MSSRDMSHHVPGLPTIYIITPTYNRLVQVSSFTIRIVLYYIILCIIFLLVLLCVCVLFYIRLCKAVLQLIIHSPRFRYQYCVSDMQLFHKRKLTRFNGFNKYEGYTRSVDHFDVHICVCGNRISISSNFIFIFFQKAELTRLATVFKSLPNVHWIIVEDADTRTTLVSNFLRNSGLNHTQLLSVTPPEVKLREKDPNWLKPRGENQSKMKVFIDA